MGLKHVLRIAILQADMAEIAKRLGMCKVVLPGRQLELISKFNKQVIALGIVCHVSFLWMVRSITWTERHSALVWHHMTDVGQQVVGGKATKNVGGKPTSNTDSEAVALLLQCIYVPEQDALQPSVVEQAAGAVEAAITELHMANEVR